MTTADLIDWAFKAIATGSVVFAVKEMRALRDSVEKLNVMVAVVIEKVSGHEKEIGKHDERLRSLETKE